MHGKALRLVALFGILIPTSGCDNVAWGGFQMDIHPPAPPPGADVGEEEVEGPVRLEAVETGPLLYLVERQGGASATLTPLAQILAGGYAPLPDPAETPQLVERFPLERWEAGTEFVLLAGGVRAGTLVTDGSSTLDDRMCLPRARGGGIVELTSAASGERTFLALRKDDLTHPRLHGSFRSVSESYEIRVGSLDVARFLIPRLNAPWPPSVLEIRQDITPLPLGDGSTGFTASFVFGDGLQVGAPAPTAYSIFYLAREEGDSFVPLFSWYQRADGAGKAFPRHVASHDLMGEGEPDLLLEVFGRESRWWAVAGRRDGEWRLLHQDPCGTPAGSGALRTFN